MIDIETTVHRAILAGCASLIAASIWTATGILGEYAPKKIAADGGVESAIRELTKEIRADRRRQQPEPKVKKSDGCNITKCDGGICMTTSLNCSTTTEGKLWPK